VNKLAAFALALLPALVATAQPAASKTPPALLASPEASSANSASREWFRNARFGMFIHWGVYSVPARGEWVMETEGWAIGDYEKYAAQFYPARFDAAAIVALAKSAGMKYITITSKHHDGFAMFGTKRSPWNIVDATPYGKDPLKELAAEAHRQGIKLFFYYSQLDWHHPDYYPIGRYGRAAGRTGGGDFARYLAFMNAQLTELLTHYGEIGGIWFDGMWDKPDADWHLDETYALIHRLQPGALVGSNHHATPYPGEDFQIFEKDLPGKNTAGFNQSGISALPLETCDTLNDSWGYNVRDNRFKNPKDIIRTLVRTSGQDANLLLNIGPTAMGEVPAEAATRLRTVGAWLGKHGEAIYGTRGGPISPRSWGVTTQKDGRIYVHVLEWSDSAIVLPDVPTIRAAFDFETGRPLALKRLGGNMVVQLPTGREDEADRIVVLRR